MTTIPASQIVRVLPGVLNAGGNAIDLNGMFLTKNTRVPIGPLGLVKSFPSPDVVASFFGPTSNEAAAAAVYFAGFDNKTAIPGAMLFTQYPAAPVPAYLQSGSVVGLTLPGIQALQGSLSIVMDGALRTAANLNLSAATSYSAAAALIQQGLDATEPTDSAFTGSIAPGSASFTGSIAANTLSVSVVATGTLVPGAAVAGPGIAPGTQIASQLTGVQGGTGTYDVTVAQTVASAALTATYGVLTVSAVASGTLSVGQALSGTGLAANTVLTGLGTGSGLAGTYYVNNTQTLASEALTSTPVGVLVSFDSVSGSLIITSGITGSPSTAAYATGTLASSLLLTQATGATISQGADATTPATFMAAIINQFTNWALFTTLFDPDGGTGNAQKYAFAVWTNSTSDRYGYVPFDHDLSPTVTAPAPASLGYLLQAANLSGTAPVWEPSSLYHAAFVLGVAASINFYTPNGRLTFAFKSQTGLVAAVTDIATATNLAGNPQVPGSFGNGYNFYGVFGTANQNFIFLNRGTVSGPFLWLDSYVNQIWLNAQLQLAILNLLVAVNSIPYTTLGYTLLETAFLDPIGLAVTAGVIRAGVTLSKSQAAAVDNTAGITISDTLQQRGWYVQILDAAPQVRQGRASPPCKFWYTDGESIQAVILNSINVQ